MSFSIRRMIPVEPQELLHGPMAEWVQLILLCAIFIAVSGAVLPKRLTQNRYGKGLVVSLGLMLGVGLFLAKDIIKFNFESFGFLAAFIIILLTAFVTFGLARMGMRKDIAVSLTYCIMFLSFSIITPTLFDTITEAFPFLNLLMIGAFFYLAGSMILKFFGRRKSIGQEAQSLTSADMPRQDEPEIEKEIKEEQREEWTLKANTIKLTTKEVIRIEDIERLLREIAELIQHKKQLSRDDTKAIATALRKIARRKDDLENGLRLLKGQADKYARNGGHLIRELEKRYHNTTDENQKKRITNELKLQKRKAELLDFVAANENKIIDFLRVFNSHLVNAVETLKQYNFSSTITYLKSAYHDLGTMKEILENLLKHEKFILSLSRKEEKTLKKEKKNR